MGLTPASWSRASPVLRRSGMWLILRERALIQHQFIITQGEVSADRRSRESLSLFPLWCLFKWMAHWTQHHPSSAPPNALIHTPMTVTLTDNLNSLRLIDITIVRRKKESVCLSRTFQTSRMRGCLKKIYNNADLKNEKKCKHTFTRACETKEMAEGWIRGENKTGKKMRWQIFPLQEVLYTVL